jgi:hypothetical protein
MNHCGLSYLASRLVGTLMCNLTPVEPADGAQGKMTFLIADCYTCWWAVTFFPKMWTILQVTCSPLSRLICASGPALTFSQQSALRRGLRGGAARG